MKLEAVDARLLDDPRHLNRQGVNEYANCKDGSLWRGLASGCDAGSRHRRGDLPSRRRKNEPDQIRSGCRCCCRVLRFAQATDFHDAATIEKLSERLLV